MLRSGNVVTGPQGACGHQPVARERQGALDDIWTEVGPESNPDRMHPEPVDGADEVDGERAVLTEVVRVGLHVGGHALPSKSGSSSSRDRQNAPRSRRHATAAAATAMPSGMGRRLAGQLTYRLAEPESVDDDVQHSVQLGALLGCAGDRQQACEDAAYLDRVDVAAQFSCCGAGPGAPSPGPAEPRRRPVQCRSGRKRSWRPGPHRCRVVHRPSRRIGASTRGGPARAARLPAGCARLRAKTGSGPGTPLRPDPLGWGSAGTGWRFPLPRVWRSRPARSRVRTRRLQRPSRSAARGCAARPRAGCFVEVS